jgi:two-component system response regulator YesN
LANVLELAEVKALTFADRTIALPFRPYEIRPVRVRTIDNDLNDLEEISIRNWQRFVHNRKSVLFRMFVSNLLFLMLPVLIGGIMYVQLEKIVYKNALQANSAIVAQLRQYVDSRVKEVQQFSFLFSMNTEIQNILSEYSRDNPDMEFRAYKLMTEISKYAPISSIVDSYTLSIKDTDTMFMGRGKRDMAFYYDNELAYRDTTYEEWHKKFIEAYSYQKFTPMMVTGSGKKLITFTQSLPVTDINTSRGGLHILLDQSKLLDNIELKDSLSDAVIYIINNEGQLLMSTGTHEREGNPLSGLALSLGFSSFEHVVDGKNSMITYDVSGQTGWTYVTAVPKDSFMAPVTRVKQGALTAAVLYLLIGMALAYYVARRNYNPLRSLLGMLKKQSPTSEAIAKWNEWDRVKYSFEQMMDEEILLKNRLQKQFPLIQSSFAGRLIRGLVDKEELRQSSLDILGETYEEDSYAVLLITIDDCNNFIRDDSEQQWAFVRFITTNILNDLLRSRGIRSLSADMERDGIACLVNHSYSPEEWKALMQDALTTMSDTLAGRFSIYVTAALSDSMEDSALIGTCYSQAEMTMEYRWLSSDQSILFYGDIEKVEQTYVYSVETEGRIINLVKHGEDEQVAELLDEVYATNFQVGAISPELGKWLMYNLISTLLRCLQGLNLQYRAVYGEEAPDARLSECGTLKEMFVEIKEMYISLCHYLKEDRDDPNQQMMNSLLQYLQEHVYDPNLGLESAADHLGLSPKYVSRLFKLHTGDTLTNYIARMRVDEAKRLLKNTDLTILDISRQLGYSTDIGLIRIFKKHEGITPGKYRQQAKES